MEPIEIINEIKDINFKDDLKYYMVAKKDNLYIIHSIDGFNLIIDETIINILKEQKLLGGIN
jgi:hypothetical protein